MMFGCSFLSDFTKAPWPSREAVRAFDTTTVKLKPATKVVMSTSFAIGVNHVCGDRRFPDVSPFNDPDKIEQIYKEIGHASFNELGSGLI